MNLPEKQFTIDGNEYVTVAHAPSQATDLALEIYAQLSGPGISLLQGLTDAQDNVSMDDDVDELLKYFDTDKISGQVSGALSSLDEKHLRELFRKTARNGKDLSVDAVYDEAYAGNWGEWLQAIYQIVQANGFLDFLSTISENKTEATEETS
jgi:hypothetical protein